MVAYQHISHGFDPVFDANSRVLVLGSFPSVLSRKNDFYYGNPQNRFWRMMAAILPSPCNPPATIEEKKRLLLAHGVALWDVIEECDIKGSSDASIKNVVPAHIEIITAEAQIDAVICNGATAGRLYKRFLQWQTGIEAHVLPSTSPANAAWSLERLIERWGAELRTIFDELPEAESPAQSKRATNSHRNETASGSRPGRIDYAAVRITPPASSWSVHKSMQGNKRKDTKPELLVRERLREAGLGGYRLQWKVPGRPDIAWPGKKVCVFVNGCFWHRCPHCHPSTPKKNVAYWEAKFARNVERDEANVAQLEADGWTVHVVWECELKKKVREQTFADLLPKLSQELGKPLRHGNNGSSPS